MAMPSPLTRVDGADQLNTAALCVAFATSDAATEPLLEEVLDEEVPVSPEPPPPQPESNIPTINAAVHAFDTLMTRFICNPHRFSVDFVKFYKIERQTDANGIIF